MSYFWLIINAARWTVGNKNVDLRVIRQNLPNFFLGIHDGVGIWFVAHAALETSESFAAILPGCGMKIEDADLIHISATTVIAVNADFGDMLNELKRKEVFPSEVAKRNDELNTFSFDSLDKIDVGATIGEDKSFHVF